MKEDRKYKIIAAAIAILLHTGLCVLLFWSALTYPPKEKPELKPIETDITFGGEFVKLGDVPLPDMQDESAEGASADNSELPGEDAADAGKEGDGSSLVSADEESALQSQKKRNGPTEEELAEQERQAKRRKQQQEKSKKINSSVKNVFNAAKDGKGDSGSPNGNASQGALTGVPGHSLGVGYTPEKWGSPSSGFAGTLTFKVRVNAQGRVTSADYVRGSGAAASNLSVRESCRKACLQSRFSVPETMTGTKIGTITWHFR